MLIKIKSKPVFEFRQDKSKTVSDDKGHAGISPLTIWLVVKNHKASYDIQIGQIWPKARAILSKDLFQEGKPYTFIIKSDNNEDFELITVLDGKTVIYQKS